MLFPPRTQVHTADTDFMLSSWDLFEQVLGPLSDTRVHIGATILYGQWAISFSFTTMGHILHVIVGHIGARLSTLIVYLGKGMLCARWTLFRSIPVLPTSPYRRQKSAGEHVMALADHDYHS